MYADDTSITFTGNDVDEMNNCINLDLERIRVCQQTYFKYGEELTAAAIIYECSALLINFHIFCLPPLPPLPVR